MTERNKTKASDVKSFLTKTGFIFEMRVSEFLRKKGYKVWVNEYFNDLEGDKKREIDIIATKKVNNIIIFLIIECKQSLIDDWIFICSDKKPYRYHNVIKHSPLIKNLNKSKIFDSLHFLNSNIPLAQNYVSFNKGNGSKAKGKQIEECLFKLPKALLDIASRVDKNVKRIYFPIALFNKQMFAVSYNKDLIIKEKKLVQYLIEFDSKLYESDNPTPIDLSTSIRHMNYTLSRKENAIKNIKITAELFGNIFQIDFVTEKGFNEYLKTIEVNVEEISTRKWSCNIKK